MSGGRGAQITHSKRNVLQFPQLIHANTMNKRRARAQVRLVCNIIADISPFIPDLQFPNVY